jgi:hypothetical protein
LDGGHYNFSGSEKRHYYSRILKFVIKILDFPQICHRIGMKTTRALLQVYTKTYISLYLHSPLNVMRAYLSASSSSSHLLISLPPLLHCPRTPNLSAGELDPGGATGKPAAPDSPRESSTPSAELVFPRPQPPCRGARPRGLYRQARRPNLCMGELCTSQSQGQDCSYDGHGRLQFCGWKICSLV